MQLVVNILFSASIYAFIAYSFSLIYYITKYFNITHAIFISLGTYFTHYLSQQIGINIWIAAPIAFILTGMVGVFNELLIFRGLRLRNIGNLKLLIASLGLYVVYVNLISIIWGDTTIIFSDMAVNEGNRLLGAHITDIQITIILICFLMMFSSRLFLKYSKFGKKMHAVSANYELIKINGINSEKIILKTIGYSAFLAAIAGLFISLDSGMIPTSGFRLLFIGMVTMIIGGVGSFWGLIIAAILLATSQNIIAYGFDSKWMDAATYLILIIFLIWRPLGFSGIRLKKIEI
jgi:branched-chain amino acid transport system permease protein